jgi:hypothetical protein
MIPPLLVPFEVILVRDKIALPPPKFAVALNPPDLATKLPELAVNASA